MTKIIWGLLILLAVSSVSGCVSIPRKDTYISQAAPLTYHTVTKGETLWRISRYYGADLKEVMRLNNIASPSQLSAGQRLLIPQPLPGAVGVPGYQPLITAAVERIVGPKCPGSKWRSITVHHSATRKGSAKAFDRNHRKRGMGGLFYHFVIGNGSGSGDGEIETGWRWLRQSQVNRPYDIQICLVGDFNRQRVSPAQYESLVKLIAVLERQYNIALKYVRKHKDVTDKATECPGRNFPFSRMTSELRNARY